MPSIYTLPPEILHGILRDAGCESLAPVSMSCVALHKFILNNKPLFKDIYLQIFDEPPPARNRVDPQNFDWEEGLAQYMIMSKILLDEEFNEVGKKTQQLEWIGDMISRILKTASPRGPSRTVKLLNSFFENKMLNQRAFLASSITFARMRYRDFQTITTSIENRQISAKLHCLYGNFIEPPTIKHWGNPYPYAASMVYDLRNYTDHTFWGPFLDDGKATVDWEKMEAAMIVLGSNLRWFVGDVRSLLTPIWNRTWSGATPQSFTPLISKPDPEEPLSPHDSEDPYNISGTWMRVVCFLDFNDLFEYNFLSVQPPPGEPRPPIDITEAVRLIVLEVLVTKIEKAGEDDHPDFPVVHFRGKSIISRSRHTSWDPNSTSSVIRGTVRTTLEGEVRWTTLSVYGGQERWGSEGIQVGGCNSARGVYGHWFDKDWDEHGPAGPTAFWKISNDIFKDGEDGKTVRELFFPDDSDHGESEFNTEDEDDGDFEEDTEIDENGDEPENGDGEAATVGS